MAKGILIATIVVLLIITVILIVTTLWLRRDFVECETTESPWCPQFTCPGTPTNPLSSSGANNGPGGQAVRTDADGNKFYSS